MVRVAVDAMGGDSAPDVVIEGALQAVRAAGDAVHVSLVGPQSQLEQLLTPIADSSELPIGIVDAPEVIGMDEAPAAAAKGKPRSSMHVGVGAMRQGAVDAFASAGNTGAMMAVALMGLGRLPGVARPALPGVFPTTTGKCILLDVGANMDCRPEHLAQFGQMGAIYSERILGVERPRVGLLNVGEEPGKGNEAAKAAHQILSELTDVHFIGNIEGRDLMQGVADVVVCDGFVGNIVLKFGESIKTVVPALIRQQMATMDGGGSSGAAAGLQQVLDGVMRRFSYEEFGGTPLLGIDGAVVIGHGGSSARAIARMIETAADLVRADVRGLLSEALATD